MFIFTDKYDRELEPFNWSFTVISKDKLAGLSTLFNQSARINNTFSINENNTERLETNNLNIDHIGQGIVKNLKVNNYSFNQESKGKKAIIKR